MALNVFDATKHHLGIGLASGGSKYGFIIDGRYERGTLRELPGQQVYGGRRELIAPVAGRGSWTQDDFSGGCFQREWGGDDAMFAHSLGILPSVQERSLITVPPFIPYNLWDVEVQPFAPVPAYPIRFFGVGARLYAAFEHGVLVHQFGVGTTWFDLSSIDGGGVRTWVRDFRYDPGENKLWLLMDKAGGNDSFLLRRNVDMTIPGGTNRHIAPVDSVNFGKGLEVQGQSFIVCLGQVLWSFTVPEDQDQGGGIVQGVRGVGVFGTATVVETISTWTRIGRLPGVWTESFAYNGLVYILSVAPSFQTSLIATDGTAILPICSFPYNFKGSGMVQYGGRIFVCGSGQAVDGTDRYGELYEVTGTSVRLVRSWQADSYAAGEEPPVFLNGMTVAAGLLWMSDSRKSLITYDLTTDSFYQASELQGPGGVPLNELHAQKFTATRERVFGWIRRNNANQAASGEYAISKGADVPAAYWSQIETSDFAAQIGRKKLWTEIRVLSRYYAVELEASVDGGANWTALTEVVSNEGQTYTTKVDLSTVLGVSDRVRFKIRFNRGTSVGTIAELLAYTVSFIYQDTKQRVWGFTVNASEAIEGRDMTEVVQDVATYCDTLWLWEEQRTVLLFTDLNGVDYKGQITAVNEVKPFISDTKREAFIAVEFSELQI